MNEVPFKFQVCYFTDLSTVEPTAETIASLAKEFNDRRLLPTTYQEVGPLGSTMRLRLQTTDREWAVDLDRNKIDVHKNAVSPSAENLGFLSQFSGDTHDIITRLLNVFPSKANRLALVTKGWLRDLSDEAMKRAYTQLLHPLPYFEESPPVEWSSRSVRRVSVRLRDTEETMNVILGAGRAQGRFLLDSPQPPFEGILVEVDINTYQGNTDTRFTADSLPEFLEHAVQVRNLLLQQLRERLDG